jgi:hypothetical protein
LLSACASGSYAAKGAAEGAATGAIAGAVGGMMSAIVFGGDVGDAAARGAVWGGSTGAVAGGMAGARTDARVREEQEAARQAEIERIREEIGADAFNGLVALAECKYDIAIANGREAARSRNRDHALAGLWLEHLAEADRGNEQRLAVTFPEIVANDRQVSDESEARELTAEALAGLGTIRKEYDLPVVCKQ